MRESYRLQNKQIEYKQWTIQVTRNIPIFFFYMNWNIIPMYILYILERLSLTAPREYVHSSLVLGSDWAIYQLSSILYLIRLPWPTQQLGLFTPTLHVSHVHPPLTTRRLNTAIQVNNMGAWHLIYNGHIHHITLLYYTISLLIFLPNFWAGRLAPNFHVGNSYFKI